MWKEEFEKVLPLLGHRNWILVVDKAFPLQSANGMTYLNSSESIESVLEYVFEKVDDSTHIKPIVYCDKEFTYLPNFGNEEKEIFENIKNIISGKDVQTILHDEIFQKLDTASKLFNVVVIKTEATIAYSSIFIELDCGYWNGEKEQKLRELMLNA